MQEPLYLQSTQLKDYACPRRWYYNYRLKRTKPSNPNMNRGSVFHLMHELFYGGLNSIDALKVEIANQHPEWVELINPMSVVFVLYLQKYGEDKEFYLVDGKPALEQKFTIKITDDIFVRGTIDYISKEHGRIYLEDIKVTKMYLSGYFFEQFELSWQMLLYSWVGKEIVPDAEGFRIDGVHARDNSIKFEKSFYPFSDNIENILKEIHFIGEEIKARLSTGAEPYSQDEEKNFPRQYAECHGKFGKCPYWDVCRSKESIQRRVIESELFIDYIGNYDEE